MFVKYSVPGGRYIQNPDFEDGPTIKQVVWHHHSRRTWGLIEISVARTRSNSARTRMSRYRCQIYLIKPAVPDVPG